VLAELVLAELEAGESEQTDSVVATVDFVVAELRHPEIEIRWN
jgi:hypothetical protein